MAHSWRTLAGCIIKGFPTLASAHDRPRQGETRPMTTIRLDCRGPLAHGCDEPEP